MVSDEQSLAAQAAVYMAEVVGCKVCFFFSINPVCSTSVLEVWRMLAFVYGIMQHLWCLTTRDGKKSESERIHVGGALAGAEPHRVLHRHGACAGPLQQADH